MDIQKLSRGLAALLHEIVPDSEVVQDLLIVHWADGRAVRMGPTNDNRSKRLLLKELKQLVRNIEDDLAEAETR